MRAGAKIGKVAVAVDRDLLVFRNVLDDIEFEPARRRARAERAELTALRHGEGVGARELNALEDVVGFRFSFHLGFDSFEVVRRNAMRQVDVVVETVLDWWTGGELRFRPDFENGGGENVRGGMAEALQIGHLGALLWRFSIVGHTRDERSRRRSEMQAPHHLPLCGLQRSGHRARDVLPLERFDFQLAASGFGQLIIFCPAIAFRTPPEGVKPASCFNPMQGGKERTGLHTECPVCDLFDPPGHA